MVRCSYHARAHLWPSLVHPPLAWSRRASRFLIGIGEELFRGSGVAITIDRAVPVRLRDAGEIDLANAAHFVQHVTAHAPADRSWILDLSGVTYADTTAIRALLSLEERFGRSFSLVGNPRLLRILEITGLKDTFRWTDAG